MVPLTNVSLAMKELVKGTMDYSMLSVIMLSTTVSAGAVGAEQAEHPGRDGERNIVQRHDAVAVGFRQVADA